MKEDNTQRTIHRINGAIIGLNGLKDELKECLKSHTKRTKEKYFEVSNNWINDRIDNRIRQYKDIKIKQLEKKVKNEVKKKK